MDKRTVLFVIALSLTLFLVNIFFQYQNVQKKQEWLKQQKAKETEKETKTKEETTQPAFTGSQPTKKAEEAFYVLETPFQQLVFSNIGGALAEVNLPFRSKDNPLSVVREIEFDRDMRQNFPNNAYFPAHPYYTPPASSGDDAVFHEKENWEATIPFYAAN